MYNSRQKLAFIDQYTTKISTTQFCENLFDTTECYESKYGRDICQFEKEELEKMFNETMGVRARSRYTKIATLKCYCKWCEQTNACSVSNAIKEADVTGVEIIKKRFVSNPLHLQITLDSIFEPEDMQTYDNIRRCYFWLAYAGVEDDDVLAIKKDDVDLSNMEIRYRGSVVPIYREGLKAIRNCKELTTFAYNHAGYTHSVYTDRANSDVLLSGGKETDLYYLRSSIGKRVAKDGKGTRISYTRIQMSGFFYRIYEREMMGETPDFGQLATLKYETGRDMGGKHSAQKKISQLKCDYKNSYYAWKLAFDL